MLVGLSDMYILCGAETRVEGVAGDLAASRSHCAIVMENNRMIGLVTTKDLALRAIKDGDRSVGEIMTREPFWVSYNTSPNEALRMMVQRRIRHLPLVDEEMGVVGVLDITACFYQAMIKMERLAKDARGLQTTVEELKAKVGGEEMEFSNYSLVKNSHSLVDNNVMVDEDDIYYPFDDNYLSLNLNSRKQKIVNDITSLIDIMKQPDLKSLLGSVERPLYLEAKSTIAAAAQLLAARNTTAALIVQEINGTRSTSNVIGILTTKDLTFRVLAMKLDPHTTKIARVMTPKPHFAHESMGIHAALRLMYEGKYLNLPIQCDDEVVGLVNVLHLTRALLRTLDSTFIKTTSSIDSELGSQNDYSQGGPAWDKFWGSLEVPSRISSSLKLHRDPKMCSNTSFVSSALPLATTFTVKLQLREVGVASLGVHDKIYRFNISVPENSDFNVHAVIMEKLYKRVPFLANTVCELGYFDKDCDFVSVQRFEDLELALGQTLVCLVKTVSSSSTIQAPTTSSSSPIPTRPVIIQSFDHTLVLTGVGVIGLLVLVKYFNTATR